MISYSIIQKLQLEAASRLDAEYYQPEYLLADRLISASKFEKFGDVLTALTDYHANGSYEILSKNVQLKNEQDFALMVRAVDLQNENFEEGVRYVSQDAYNFLKKTKVFGKEIIIDKIGNAGEVYLMPTLDRPVTLGMNLFLLRLKDSFSPEFVYIFLKSKIGKALIMQKVTGSVPNSIDKESVRSVKIPVVPKFFNAKIKELVDNIFELKKQTNSYYVEAEKLLLSNLSIFDFRNHNLFAIARSSEVSAVNRFDAEYFNSPCNKMLLALAKGKTERLGDLSEMTKGIEPGADVYWDEGRLFIRVSSISKNGIIDKDQKYLSEDLYNEYKNDYQPQVGEILLTKDASIGIACVVRESVDGVISSGVMRLKLKDKINPEYLTLVLNSMVGRLQAERDAGGSIIAHWKPEQIKNLIVPILPVPTQNKIADLLLQSYQARKKAAELLEEAKLKVEEIIEKGG